MEGGDQSCIECEGESVAWVRVVGLAVGLVVACLLLVAAYLCYQTMAARGAKTDAGSLRSTPRAPRSTLHLASAASTARRQRSTSGSAQARDCIVDSMCRWVKPNFVSGGAVPLSIYGKVRLLSSTTLSGGADRHSDVYISVFTF
jgi:hypothetical protein